MQWVTALTTLRRMSFMANYKIPLTKYIAVTWRTSLVISTHSWVVIEMDLSLPLVLLHYLNIWVIMKNDWSRSETITSFVLVTPSFNIIVFTKRHGVCRTVSALMRSIRSASVDDGGKSLHDAGIQVGRHWLWALSSPGESQIQTQMPKKVVAKCLYAIEKHKAHDTTDGFALDLQNQVEILADIPDVEDSWMAMKTDGERLKYDGSKTATWQLIDDRWIAKQRRDQADTGNETSLHNHTIRRPWQLSQMIMLLRQERLAPM